MPIHRLEQEPTVLAKLADLTCDSDGIVDHFIDHFIDVEDVKGSLVGGQLAAKAEHLTARRVASRSCCCCG